MNPRKTEAGFYRGTYAAEMAALAVQNPEFSEAITQKALRALSNRIPFRPQPGIKSRIQGGFAQGGYTSAGGKVDPVVRGDYVLPTEAVARRSVGGSLDSLASL